MKHASVILMCAVLLTTGCYHTTYRNLHGTSRPSRPEAELDMPGVFDGWRHFFVMGLAPTRKDVDARGECEGGSLEEVHTGQNAVQAVVATAISLVTMIVVYSPYVANPICARDAS